VSPAAAQRAGAGECAAGTPAATELLDAYAEHVATVQVTKPVRADRYRAARRFVDRHPDLGAWMGRPAPQRLADLHRAKAWPFISWCFIHGWLRPDLELLLAKPGGVQLPTVWSRQHADQVHRVAEVGGRLGWSPNWIRQVSVLALATICCWTGKPLDRLTEDDFAAITAELDGVAYVSASARTHARTRQFALQQACYQLGLLGRPPRKAGPTARSPAELAHQIHQPEIRREVIRYAQTLATTLRPGSVYARIKAIMVLCDWLAGHHPTVRRLDQLERTAHIEPFLAWARQRPWRGANGHGRTVSLVQFHHDVVDLRVFFDDIACWGWASAPRGRLLFLTDLPRLPNPLPRALSADVDRKLMAAVTGLDDLLVRAGLLVLRATGMRIGELLDLELDSLVDFASHGTWLRVPLGKLGTERMVPLDEPTLATLDAWIATRGQQRPLPHPRHGRPADFLFVERGRRPTAWRLRRGLDQAAATAGLVGPDSVPLHITPHQLRHTFGTSLINAGMSLPALMALLGHVTPEMTLRYAKLASPTVRAAYQAAMDKIRPRQPLPLLVGTRSRALVPDRVEWLRSEMLKTRVAHGYCSRDLVADACPYANICEQCDNFVTTTEFLPALEQQLADVHALHDDATTRGWHSEAARHAGVIDSINSHVQRLKQAGDPRPPA
jgi:integrase